MASAESHVVPVAYEPATGLLQVWDESRGDWVDSTIQAPDSAETDIGTITVVGDQVEVVEVVGLRPAIYVVRGYLVAMDLDGELWSDGDAADSGVYLNYGDPSNSSLPPVESLFEGVWSVVAVNGQTGGLAFQNFGIKTHGPELGGSVSMSLILMDGFRLLLAIQDTGNDFAAYAGANSPSFTVRFTVQAVS